MFVRALLAFLLLTTAAFAEVPTDQQLLLARAQAAEAQTKYLSALLLRVEAEDKATAAYWAAYIGAPEPTPK